MQESWWQDAVIYQVYLRSFADADGDGVGDLAGLRERLGYLADLGVDALWLNPCYPSPQRDHGYDIADYFAIDPAYGSTTDLVGLVADAHLLGLRVVMDMVANHCSDQHEWFQDAVAAPTCSAARDRFVFRDGRGPAGEEPPNNWASVFGGPAWTRLHQPDGTPGQWYLHSFDSSQPDFNWRNPEVPQHFRDVLTFWFDLGVDGFRIDVAHGLFTAEDLADIPEGGNCRSPRDDPMWDQPEVHEVYRTWRAIGDAYRPEPKYFIGEIWVATLERLRPYLAPGHLHQAFNFDLLVQPWDAARMRTAIDAGLDQARQIGTPTAWALNSHDVHRVVTRYGQEQDSAEADPTDMIAAARRSGPVDLELGTARARAVAMLLLALPGTVFLYQGEELGLPEVFELPAAVRQDPIWIRSGGTELGRDGCRVPLPWAAGEPAFGFSPAGTAAAPWLPQPASFGGYAVDRQEAAPTSFLNLYRTLLRTRRTLFDSDALRWLETGSDQVLAFARGDGVCIVNLGSDPVDLPDDPAGVVVASSCGLRTGAELAGNHAVWLDRTRTHRTPTTAGGRRTRELVAPGTR
ncbi:glycoside hydrolase family 13 protein [Cellulomonas sp. KRMCY2]|uniref:glycoside hydrolase family 13 protein n=1 Tax=Cellulomonas sp. KRMCY2 TaxID=1304865 RepID=UPI00045E6B63|nr:glycoside hydrolase family 13 protein [Cellulomonas sp. KRMCY2]